MSPEAHISHRRLVTCDSPDTRDNDGVTTRDRGEGGRLEAAGQGLLQSIDPGLQWLQRIMQQPRQPRPRPRLLHITAALHSSGRCLQSSLHAVTSVSPLQPLQE